jgi:hypothetical protein
MSDALPPMGAGVSGKYIMEREKTYSRPDRRRQALKGEYISVLRI